MSQNRAACGHRALAPVTSLLSTQAKTSRMHWFET